MTNYLFWKRFAQGKLKTHVSSLKVRIPSPKEILSWSERRLPSSTLVGKVDNAHTVEHDTLRPVSGGLFCERIFGPIATNVCACLRKKGWNEDYCKICEVQFTKSRLRRYQMGHILLAAPVIHVWALQGGYLASLLGKKNFGIRSIAYGKVMSQSKLVESYTYGLTSPRTRDHNLPRKSLWKPLVLPSSSEYPMPLSYLRFPVPYPYALEPKAKPKVRSRVAKVLPPKGAEKITPYPIVILASLSEGERGTAVQRYRDMENESKKLSHGVIKKSSQKQYPRNESLRYLPKNISFPLFLWTRHNPFSTNSIQNPESNIEERETFSSLQPVPLPLASPSVQGHKGTAQKNKIQSYLQPSPVPYLKEAAKETLAYSEAKVSGKTGIAFESPSDRFWIAEREKKKEEVYASQTHHFPLWKKKVIGRDSTSKNHQVIRTFSRASSKALSKLKVSLILPPTSTVSLVHLIYPFTSSITYDNSVPFAKGDYLSTPVLLHPCTPVPLYPCTPKGYGVWGMGYGVAKVLDKKTTYGNSKGLLHKLGYAKDKVLNYKSIGLNPKFLSYGCTNEGVHVQKFFGQDRKTKCFKFSSTTKKVISVLSFLYTYKKYPSSERQKGNVKKKKKRVYERGNVLPFHQFILYKPDCFKRISQFFDSLNKEQAATPKLPLPFYSRLESVNFTKLKSPLLFKDDANESKTRLVVKNSGSSGTCMLSPPFYLSPVPFAFEDRHKSTAKIRFPESSKGSALCPLLLPSVQGHRITTGLSRLWRKPYTPFAALPSKGLRFKRREIENKVAFLPNTLASPQAKISQSSLPYEPSPLGTQAVSQGKAGDKMHSYKKLIHSLTFISPRGIKDSRREIETFDFAHQSSHIIDSAYSSPSGQVTSDLKAKRSFGIFNKFDVLYWSHIKTGDTMPALLYSITYGNLFYPYTLLGYGTGKGVELQAKKEIQGTLPCVLSSFSFSFNTGQQESRTLPICFAEQSLPTVGISGKSQSLLPPVIRRFTGASCANVPYSEAKVQKKLKNIEFTGPSVLSQTLKNLNLVLLDRLVNWKWKIGKTQLDSFLLQNKLTKRKRGLRNKLAKTKIILTRRKKLIQSFLNTKQLPEWMILSVLPVLPPALRPILELEPNNVVVSDLNTLYQTVIRRNDALMGLLTFRALEIDILNRQVSLQQAIEKLFDKGAGTKKRPVKSLSQGFHGKRGLFRLHLLGKRVDYSGRSVIVVGPRLKLHECGLPKEMALVLFLPFLIARLKRRKVANNTSQAKQLIIRKDKQIWSHLKSLIYEHPVLLNRAPTLHRLGFQAFQPILVSGKAIILPALVCTGFNADFDGDQMAVHVPLSYAARAESWKLLYAKNNMLSPATGKPVIVLSQEMILGCYCSSLVLNKTHFALRREKLSLANEPSFSHRLPPFNRKPLPLPVPLPYSEAKVQGHRGEDENYARKESKSKACITNSYQVRAKLGKGISAFSLKSIRYFTTFQEVHMALNHNKIALQTAIWLRIPSFEDNLFLEEPLEIRLDAIGHSFRSYGQSQRHFSKSTKSQNQIKGISYVRTSAGRIQLNEIFYSSLRTSDLSLS